LTTGNGSINPTPNTPSYGLGSWFTWHGVTGSGGADFIGDSFVNSSDNYFDDYGLIWAVKSQATNVIVGGLNIWANSNVPGTLYATNVSVGGANVFENSGNGTFTVASVPEADSYAMLLGGLVILSLIARRRKSA
jgi:hypothetical protein